MYLWERPDWPAFRWDDRRLVAPLAAARMRQGVLIGRMSGLGFDVHRDAHAEAVIADAVKSSAIEGERLDVASVRSSVARHLGIPDVAMRRVDDRTEGVVRMLLEATTDLEAPLTVARLLDWQSGLFPDGRSGLFDVQTGQWRDDHDGPMQVVSGPIGRQRVHFEAPAAVIVADEMSRFLDWFNAPSSIDGVLRAGVAHLWFVTIHPFADGNGRVARAIADRALAQCERSSRRYYSLSSEIRRRRAAYYEILERTQKGDVDITDWLAWFLECFTRAVDDADSITGGVVRKALFWQRVGGDPLGDRQRRVLNRVLDGFEGALTTAKWASMTKVSIPTAQRDINDLIERRILVRNEGGSRLTSYRLAD